jgi:hypothetical protein
MSTFLGLPEFIFSLVGKFSLAFLVFTATILFLPSQIADDSVMDTLRTAYKTELWLGLFMSSSMFVSYVCKSAWKTVADYIGEKHIEQKNQKKQQATVKRVIERLSSLGPRELLWIQYCLYNNQQTFACAQTDITANSLLTKAVITLGSGSVLNSPFTIKDDVWSHLKENSTKFLPDLDQRTKSEFERRLKGFKESFSLY